MVNRRERWSELRFDERGNEVVGAWRMISAQIASHGLKPEIDDCDGTLKNIISMCVERNPKNRPHPHYLLDWLSEVQQGRKVRSHLCIIPRGAGTLLTPQKDRINSFIHSTGILGTARVLDLDDDEDGEEHNREEEQRNDDPFSVHQWKKRILPVQVPGLFSTLLVKSARGDAVGVSKVDGLLAEDFQISATDPTLAIVLDPNQDEKSTIRLLSSVTLPNIPGSKVVFEPIMQNEIVTSRTSDPDVVNLSYKLVRMCI